MCIRDRLSKHKTETNIQFIDASGEEFYKKEMNNNILLQEHIDAIMQLFDSKEEKEYVSKNIDNEKIAEGNYDLSVSSYVDKKEMCIRDSRNSKNKE